MLADNKNIDPNNIPQHIAIVMDGNGRWATNKGVARIFGHRNAVKAVRASTEGCSELGVEFLTLYAFSIENWARPKYEVEALMEMLVEVLRKEITSLNKNKVKLQAIGDLQRLPSKCRNELYEAIEMTKDNKGLNLILALSYSGRWDILEATKALTRDVKNGTISILDIDEKLFSNYLATASIPNPELFIRTGGEMRVSNFLLWQIAYTELYITKKLWPDFCKIDLYHAVMAYQNRERRFGKVSGHLL